MALFLMITIAAIAAWFYTESPRYLVKSGQIDRAKQVFAHIAEQNGVQPITNQRFESLFGKQKHKAGIESPSETQQPDEVKNQNKFEDKE